MLIFFTNNQSDLENKDNYFHKLKGIFEIYKKLSTQNDKCFFCLILVNTLLRSYNTFICFKSDYVLFSKEIFLFIYNKDKVGFILMKIQKEY